MTPEDAIKKLVADELEKRGIEDARVKRKAEDRADFDRYIEQSARREYPPSAVDARNAPVQYEEIFLPMQPIPFTQPDSGGGAPPVAPSPVDLGGGDWETVLYCKADGSDDMRQVLSREVP